MTPDRASVAAVSVDAARILVGIPALNEERHIEACILSLMQPEAETSGVRLVVADGGSSDRTVAIVADLARRFPNVAVIDNPARLQSAGLNRIVEIAAGPGHDIFVRCDAHSVYPPRYVRNVADSLVARDAAALATSMDAVGTNSFEKAAAWIADTRIGSGGSAHRGGKASGYVEHGHHAGFRLAWFRQVGGYDETFSHNEDAELDHRIGRAGGRIWLDAGIRLEYAVRPTLPALARQYWRYGAGRARAVRKHRMRLRARQLAAPVLVGSVFAGLVLTPFTALGLMPLAAYFLVVAAASAAGCVALRSPCGLWAGPAMAAMHLPWGAAFLRETAFPSGRRPRRSSPARLPGEVGQ